MDTERTGGLAIAVLTTGVVFLASCGFEALDAGAGDSNGAPLAEDQAVQTVEVCLAGAQVQTYPTGLIGDSPVLASAGDGSLHMVYQPTSGLRHARLVNGSWLDDRAISSPVRVSRSKWNRPALAVGPDSAPNVVWARSARFVDEVDHTKDVYYWNGASTSLLFNEYTEYVAIGVDTGGSKVFVAAVPFFPGDTLAHGVAWAHVTGSSLGSMQRIAGANNGSKHVLFCSGSDGSLHLVWRVAHAYHLRYQGGAWGSIADLGTPPEAAEQPACAVDAAGHPHVVWQLWKEITKDNWIPISIRYATKRGSAWSPNVGGLVLRSLTAGSSVATVAVSPGGEVLAAWEEGGSLYVATSMDDGNTFTSAQAVLTGVAADFRGVPVVHHGGHFQGVYVKASSGELTRVVFPCVGACMAGQSETQACGNCGTQSRTCTSSCQWGSWGACSGQGACAPAQAATQACGNCGAQSRICTSSCQWGSWGACSGQGVCAPVGTTSRACGTCGSQSRACSNSCQWGAWRPCEEGSCSDGGGKPGCGDGLCTGAETCDGCPADCGGCPPAAEVAVGGCGCRGAGAPSGVWGFLVVVARVALRPRSRARPSQHSYRSVSR